MHWTDEQLQELDHFYSQQPPPSDDLVTEWEYYEQEREKDYEQANCEHRNMGEEMATNNPFGPMMRVCYDCGREWR